VPNSKIERAEHSVPVSQTALLTRPLFAFNKEPISFFFEVLKKLNGTENAAKSSTFKNAPEIF
jgi:hypothetical protein